MKIGSRIGWGAAAVFWLFVTFSQQVLAACRVDWMRFIATAESEAITSISAQIAECRQQGMAAQAKPNDRAVILLVQLVEAKNPQAIQLILSVSDLLDGGNLEDVARGFGQLADSDPAIFLRLAEGPQQSFLLTRALPMMSEAALDDPEIRQLRIRERIARIQAVNDPALAEVKKKALDILARR